MVRYLAAPSDDLLAALRAAGAAVHLRRPRTRLWAVVAHDDYGPNLERVAAEHEAVLLAVLPPSLPARRA
jgi:CO/xanthine dehydrogenase FAD-binding subunit